MSLSELKFYLKKPSLYKWSDKGFNIKFYETLSGTYYQNMGIRTVLDIGANTGQSAVTFRQAFPEATIHAFEPLPDCFKLLTKNVEGINKLILHNIALGNETGSLSFEENEFSPSSSALPMTKEHVANFPFTKNRKQTIVKSERLDNLSETLSINDNVLIKIDVQGYEKHVITGGRNIISRAKLLIVETSFEKMYEGEPLFNEIYDTILKMGFTYAGAFDQLLSPQSQKVLQQDALFVKP